MNLFETLVTEVVQMLKDMLPPELHYHSVDHTLDVVLSTEKIAKSEGLTEKDVDLIKTAALFHDSGFITGLENHEENGCRIANEVLKKYDYNGDVAQQVCEMIMATKIPQSPKSKLAEILCDADLDYLGREDFFEISEKLFLERKAIGIVESKNDWNLKQIDFFNAHHYFTSTSIKLRSKQKQKHLDMIIAMIEK